MISRASARGSWASIIRSVLAPSPISNPPLARLIRSAVGWAVMAITGGRRDRRLPAFSFGIPVIGAYHLGARARIFCGKVSMPLGKQLLDPRSPKDRLFHHLFSPFSHLC